MDSQDHKTAATSLGREGSGVHLCHRCGWPFPKPHPSSKHRRAHRKHCGTIEGYKIILSEEHDQHLAVSDDEKRASDDEHTPSPNLVKKNAEGSGKVGDKSNKSEDDVFSDAVTEFSDSGISPRLEEHFESVREMNNSMDQKGLEGGDLHEGGSLKVDEIADINEQSNDPRKSVEVPSAEPLVSGTNAEAVLGHDAMKSVQDSNIQAQEDKLASVALNSEEDKILEEDLCDNSASGVVKRDLPSQTETFKNVHSAENSTSYETGEVSLVDETQENIDASVGVEEASQSTKDILLDRSISSNQIMEFKDALDTVATLDSAGQTFVPEDDQTTREFNNGEEKSNGKLLETENEKSEGAFTLVKAVLDSKMPSDDSTGFPTSFAVDSEERNFEELSKDDEESRDDGFEKSEGLDTVTGDVLDKNALPTASFEINNDEEKSNGNLLEIGNEKSKGAFTEVKTGLDSKVPSDDSTGFPTSFAVDSEARNFEELSKGEEESRDDGFENSKGLDTVTGDVLDKNALPTASFEFNNDEEKSNGKLLETGNEKSEGAFTEVKAVLDSKTSTDDSTGYPTSFAVDSEARNFEELSKDDEESRDDGFEKSKGLDTVTGDVLDKNALPTASFEFNNNEEKSNGNLLETGNEKSEGAFSEVKAGLDSKKPSDDSTGFPTSFAVDSEARNFEELSKVNEESRDDGYEKSKGLDTVTGDVLDNNSLPTASLEVPVSPIISEPSPNIHMTGNGDTVESVDVVETICEPKVIVSSEKTPEQSIAKESASLTTESESLSENSADNAKASESIDSATETKLDLEDNVVLSREISENPTPKVLETSATSIVSSGEVYGNVLESGKCSVTPSLKDPVSSPSDLLETCATGDDKTVANVEDVTVVESKSLQVEVVERLRKENDGVSAVNHSGSSSSRSDSLEANCGSVVSDTLETNSQKQRTEEARSDKSDTFEAPSFMTLVQSGGEGEEVKAAKEIETEQNNQQAGWFPSIKNVVNESEGRKKNEEIIAKVTNWSPVKQQHGPLKSLLDEVKSPRSSSPASYQKIETESKDNNGGVATLGSVIAPTSKNQETNKDVEEWNSPARYPPIGIKEEKKKKTRSFWVPFVCCSSVHRDL